MNNRRVLITGAGSGLGLALAQRYARAGARLACVDLNPERAQQALQTLTGSGHLALTADVGSDADIDALKRSIDQAWGGLDVLINNAGIASGGEMVDTTMDEWRNLFEINLFGVVRGCRAFLPDMLKAGAGQIINTASFAGLAGAPNIMSYGASKAAVVALSEQLRAETHGSGVAVSVVCPAFFQTNLLESWQGSPAMRGFAEKMMARSIDTLDSVADAVFAACERRQFLILPTKREPMLWRIKRWFPSLYYRQLLKMKPTAKAK